MDTTREQEQIRDREQRRERGLYEAREAQRRMMAERSRQWWARHTLKRETSRGKQTITPTRDF